MYIYSSIPSAQCAFVLLYTMLGYTATCFDLSVIIRFLTFIICETAAVVIHDQCLKGSFKPIHVVKIILLNNWALFPSNTTTHQWTLFHTTCITEFVGKISRITLHVSAHWAIFRRYINNFILLNWYIYGSSIIFSPVHRYVHSLYVAILKLLDY
jgi:hypothetical protein